MFSSYVAHPASCKFEGQDPNEKILLLLRAHPITNLSWMFLMIVLFTFPFFVPTILSILNTNLNLLPESFQLIFLIINYLLVIIVGFEGFLNWYFNATIITNEKIVDMDFEHLLYKAVNLAPLAKIEETDSVTAGIIGTIFNFGNVRVQTAGENIAIEMKNVPHSAQVADMILDLVNKPHERILKDK